jgi:hypothetical protein
VIRMQTWEVSEEAEISSKKVAKVAGVECIRNEGMMRGAVCIFDKVFASF